SPFFGNPGKTGKNVRGRSLAVTRKRMGTSRQRRAEERFAAHASIGFPRFLGGNVSLRAFPRALEARAPCVRPRRVPARRGGLGAFARRCFGRLRRGRAADVSRGAAR